MKKGLLFVLLFFFAKNFLTAQDRTVQALDSFAQKFPQEKVYLLFSKERYVAGDNIWFKAFVFDGYSHSAISTALYIELYNSSKSLISKKVVPLFEGEGQGSFALADSLKEGAYFIRAYTHWMLNFSEEFQYLHSFLVYNMSSPQKVVPVPTPEWTAGVFPEGGTFIEEVSTKVAVRIFSHGEAFPKTWDGYVIDAARPNEKIVSFTSLDPNVASFTITPLKGKQYKVIVQDGKNKPQTISMPIASPSGVSLKVNSTPETIFYSLQFKNQPQAGKVYKIIGTINSNLVYKASINKPVPEIASSIPADKLINGVLQLTVFDETDKVVAQRLCFVQAQQLRLEHPSFPPLYLSKLPRGLNAFDIKADTNYLSYTVLVQDGYVPNNLEKENMLSTLWLTGDFTNEIYEPAKYLGVDAAVAGLDALMISEKWKRFDWADMAAEKFPEIRYKPDLSYISYKGTVTSSGRPVPNQTVNLIIYFPDSTNQIVQVNTDKAGVFEMKNLMFEEPLKVYYQINDKNIGARAVDIIFELQNTFNPYKTPLPPSGYTFIKRPVNDSIPRDVARSLITRNNQKDADTKFKTLQEVKVVAQKKSNKEKLNEQLSTGLFKSMNEDVFDLVNENQDAASFPNIIQWLQGRVAGLQVQMQNGDYIPMIRGSRVGIYLDEMQVDANTISSLPVSDIAMVKVIKGPFIGGIGGGGGGAVAIYTRRGNTQAANSKKPPSLNSNVLTGFDKAAAFYSPDYKDASAKRVDKDSRDVLYWNPALLTDRSKMNVRFYNNDDAQNLRVVILGFSRDDVPMYYNEIFK